MVAAIAQFYNVGPGRWRDFIALARQAKACTATDGGVVHLGGITGGEQVGQLMLSILFESPAQRAAFQDSTQSENPLSGALVSGDPPATLINQSELNEVNSAVEVNTLPAQYSVLSYFIWRLAPSRMGDGLQALEAHRDLLISAGIVRSRLFQVVNAGSLTGTFAAAVYASSWEALEEHTENILRLPPDEQPLRAAIREGTISLETQYVLRGIAL